MKKIFLTLMLALLINHCSFNACAQTNSFEALATQMRPVVKNLFVKMLIAGVVVWASGEILFDTGHRYLACKEIALSYAEELRRDGRNFLTENEITFWSFIQGISAIPIVWWRELCATALTLGFVHCVTNLNKQLD